MRKFTGLLFVLVLGACVAMTGGCTKKEKVLGAAGATAVIGTAAYYGNVVELAKEYYNGYFSKEEVVPKVDVLKVND